MGLPWRVVQDDQRPRTAVPVWFFTLAAGAASANAIQGDETEGTWMFALLVVAISFCVFFWETHGYTIRRSTP